MEFFEFLRIIKKKQSLFWTIWSIIILLGFCFAALFPTRNQATLSLDIARQKGNAQISEYQFDQFYRLEADDRFSQTISEWLKDPNVKNQIEKKAANELSVEKAKKAVSSLRAEKRSVNFVQVKFFVDQASEASIVASAIKETLSGKISILNDDAEDQRWFKIIVTGPTVALKRISLTLALGFSLVFGLATSVFIILFLNYFQKHKKMQNNEDRN